MYALQRLIGGVQPGVIKLNDVYQVGKGNNPNVNPFGLLYSGTFTSVPEPSVLALTGSGFWELAWHVVRPYKYLI
ncbi:hypothetical protein N9112_01545 [bacterium]|jgi:hypothetical protein|nr:hypothetical protein [bacterium]